jgi:hypothetical protein
LDDLNEKYGFWVLNFNFLLSLRAIFSIIRLFEGGILEKITNDEYENMYKFIKTDVNADESTKNEGQKTTSKSERMKSF